MNEQPQVSIEITDAFGGTVKQIVGFVDGRDIIVLQGTAEDGFRVQSSACLPVNFEKASHHVACIKQAFAAADRIISERKIAP